MKVKQKTKAQFDRKQALARIEKRAEFTKYYNDLMESFEFTDPVKLKETAAEFFGTEEAFVELKLKEWDAAQPKYPQGKYQDYGEVYVTYQQKFVEVLRVVSPQVFEDLRNLIPHFNILFGKDIEKYFDVIRNLRSDAFIFNAMSPPYRSPDSNYVWDALKDLIISTQYEFHLSTSDNKNSIPIPKELAIIYEKIGDNDFWIQHLKYNIEGFESVLKKAFQNTATDESLILSNFLQLQSQIYIWIDRYHLHKDWLIEYAYFILYQMSKNENMPVKELPILKPRYSPTTVSYDFVFNSQGWWASKETVEDYKAILREEFETALENHLVSAFSYLQLDKKTKFTKPKNTEKLKWLVAWNEGATFPEIADCFCKSEDTIDDGIDELLKFDLPKRKGKKGRKTHRIVSPKRLAEIKEKEIGENLL